jgi:hypothetical protein
LFASAESPALSASSDALWILRRSLFILFRFVRSASQSAYRNAVNSEKDGGFKLQF